MNKINHVEAKQAWLTSVSAEATVWLAHIRRKVRTIKRIQRTNYASVFYEGELLFNIFAFLNWLGHIDLRNDRHIEEKRFVEWLVSVTKWPYDVTESFWYCLRNPNMHTGRTFIFSDYERKGKDTSMKLRAAFHQDLSFDPMKFQSKRFKPKNEEDGWSAAANPFKQGELAVMFYFPGVLRKLNQVLKHVLYGIKGLTNQQVEGLVRVNRKILPFRVVK